MVSAETFSELDRAFEGDTTKEQDDQIIDRQIEILRQLDIGYTCKTSAEKDELVE